MAHEAYLDFFKENGMCVLGTLWSVDHSLHSEQRRSSEWEDEKTKKQKPPQLSSREKTKARLSETEDFQERSLSAFVGYCAKLQERTWTRNLCLGFGKTVGFRFRSTKRLLTLEALPHRSSGLRLDKTKWKIPLVITQSLLWDILCLTSWARSTSWKRKMLQVEIK